MTQGLMYFLAKFLVKPDLEDCLRAAAAGVDFIKVGRSVQIHLHYTPVESFSKVQRKGQKIGVGCKTIYEINPWCKKLLVIVIIFIEFFS